MARRLRPAGHRCYLPQLEVLHMRKLFSGMVLAGLALSLPAAAHAQRRTTAASGGAKHEFGIDVGLSYVKPQNVSGGIVIQTPVDVRIGFVPSRGNMMWEGRLTADINTVGGTTRYLLTPGVDVLFSNTPGGHRRGMYFGGGAGLVLADAGGGTAFEGAYRVSRGKFDFGLRGGIFTPGGNGNSRLLVGAEARERVVTHTEDFPLDGALILGVGGQFSSGSSFAVIPVGLSLGRRIDPRDSKISIVPYVQPTGFLVAGNGTSDFLFSLGLGADFRLTPRFDARISAGLGDLEGVSISAVWVH